MSITYSTTQAEIVIHALRDNAGPPRHQQTNRYTGVHKLKQIARTGDLIIAVTDMTQERHLVAHAARVHLPGASMAVMSMDLVRVEPKPDIPNT